MNIRLAYIILLLQCLHGIIVCEYLQKEEKPKEILLAKVYDKQLLLKDLAGLFPANANHADSAEIIKNYITRWTQDQVYLSEAEKHIPGDLVIGELIKKYRESLIGLNFQQRLIQENLDSTVTEAEITDYYEKNKDQYQLETSIVRCFVVKIRDDIREEKNIKEWWEDPTEGNLKKLARIVDKYNGLYHLEDSAWHNVNDIGAIFPKNKVNTKNWTKGESLSFSADQNLFLFKVLELVSKQEPAPLSYVSPKAKLVILNKRKTKLIEDFKTKLYETEMRKNNIQILYN